MIDEKFSAINFAALGLDTEKSRELANMLEKEVSREMHRVVEKRFTEIVKELNSMGHNLRLEQEPYIGDISWPKPNIAVTNRNLPCGC